MLSVCVRATGLSLAYIENTAITSLFWQDSNFTIELTPYPYILESFAITICSIVKAGLQYDTMHAMRGGGGKKRAGVYIE